VAFIHENPLCLLIFYRDRVYFLIVILIFMHGKNNVFFL